MSFCSVLLCFAVLTSSPAKAYPLGSEQRYIQPVRTWTVNLDAPPESRWPWEALNDVYGQYLQEAIGLIGQFIPKEFQGILEDAAADIMPYLGGNTTLFLLQPLDTSFVQTTRLKLLLEQESAT